MGGAGAGGSSSIVKMVVKLGRPMMEARWRRTALRTLRPDLERVPRTPAASYESEEQYGCIEQGCGHRSPITALSLSRVVTAMSTVYTALGPRSARLLQYRVSVIDIVPWLS